MAGRGPVAVVEEEEVGVRAPRLLEGRVPDGQGIEIGLHPLPVLVRRLDADKEHHETLAELAALLGHHALALDLAAARLETTSLHDAPRLVERLERHRAGDNPFEVLALGDRRDENLEAALALSYEPLDDEHQLAFRLLGVIPPGLDFGRALALAVWGVDLEDEAAREAAEDRLDGLARAALVGRTPAGRYWLHQNLGAYAGALLRRTAERDAGTG